MYDCLFFGVDLSLQAYPSTVMYYYPPNNVQSPPSSVSSVVAATPVSGNANNSSYGNRGTSPSSSHNRENNSNKSNSNSSASTSTTGGNNRNSYNRNVAASYAKGAAIYQPPIYSMANLQMPPQAQDRSVINGKKFPFLLILYDSFCMDILIDCILCLQVTQMIVYQ